MRWLILSVLVCAFVATTANQLHCQYSESHTCSKHRNGRFFLDGHKFVLKYNEDKFSVNCDGWQALDSEALPRSTTELHVPIVKLDKCPLPASRTLVDVLTSFNVKLLQTKNETDLVINDLPLEPQLTASHFIGLEHLTRLEIKPQSALTLSADFLAGLKSLRSIKLTRVLLLGNSSTSGLELLLALPVALEKIQLVDWKEKQLAAFARCDSLRQLDLYRPRVDTLPKRWLAACPHLEKLTLKSAENLVSLPSGLLEGATALKRLTITRCMGLQSFPEGFLQGAPNLLALDLSHNRLQTLSSELFQGPALRSLSLSSNLLKSEALEALASLTSLTKLDLGFNRDFKNLCDQNGYSRLQNLTQLRELSFWQSDVTHICRDWRESMTFLESLDLRETEIKELTFADLQYKRDETVKNAEVLLDDASITSVHFTEEDYNKALKTPATNAPVKLTWGYDELECDCKMYWTRKAMDISNFKSAVSMDRFLCNNGRYFKDSIADQICPENERATA